MAAPIRWLVRIGGLIGDKDQGIAELKLTAERGQYLAPFARILLAIAYVRDKDKPRARELLASLEAPVYIERVGLGNNKQIMQAGRAVRRERCQPYNNPLLIVRPTCP